MSKYVRVASLPDCDLCGEPARLDVKTTRGPWGNFCVPCATSSGLWNGQLGTGIGQALVLDDTEELAIVAALLGFTVVALESA